MKNNLMLRARGGFDELYTPEYGIKPLLKYLKITQNFITARKTRILCPFDDRSSNYYKVLTEAGYEVTTSHQWDGKDFFDYTKSEVAQFDFIISNPPYSIKDKVLEHLYKLDKPFAMLLPISSLEGVKRNKMFTEHGIQLLVLNKRINFMEGNGKSAYFNTSYFCWKILPSPLIFTEVEK